jgi:hypothetical protein
MRERRRRGTEDERPGRWHEQVAMVALGGRGETAYLFRGHNSDVVFHRDGDMMGL